MRETGPLSAFSSHFPEPANNQEDNNREEEDAADNGHHHDGRIHCKKGLKFDKLLNKEKVCITESS